MLDFGTAQVKPTMPGDEQAPQARELGRRRGQLLSLDTLGKLIDNQCEASLWCRTCKSVSDIDLPSLALQVGRDWMFVGTTWPVTCAQCESGDVEVRIVPGHTPAVRSRRTS